MEISRLLIHNSSSSAFRTYCRQNDPGDHSSIFIQSEKSSGSSDFNQVKTVFFNGDDKLTKDKKPNGRKPRTTFSLDQSDILEKEYKNNEYLNRPNRLKLAERLNLTEGQIKIWFQNRRAKDKRIEKAQLDQHLRCLTYGYDPSALFYRADVEMSSETEGKNVL